MPPRPPGVRRAPIARRAGRQNGGLLVDAWHYFRGTDNEAALRALPAERIIAVQFDDVDAPQARPARTRSAGYLPGKGTFDHAPPPRLDRTYEIF